MNRLLSVKEVAALLQTSRVQVRRMIQSGELAALKVGREYRIPLAALEAFIRAALEYSSPLTISPLWGILI